VLVVWNSDILREQDSTTDSGCSIARSCGTFTVQFAVNLLNILPGSLKFCIQALFQVFELQPVMYLHQVSGALKLWIRPVLLVRS
jgi:hypothetical protein